jgi:hypothetical protein
MGEHVDTSRHFGRIRDEMALSLWKYRVPCGLDEPFPAGTTLSTGSSSAASGRSRRTIVKGVEMSGPGSEKKVAAGVSYDPPRLNIAASPTGMLSGGTRTTTSSPPAP